MSGTTLPAELQAVLAEALRLLSRGVADRRSPLHTPTVATVGLDGRPRLRTVVMRGFDPARREIRFHTDARSPKAAELAREPRIGLHVYDAGAKVQMRLDAIARLHHGDELAQSAWVSSQPMSRVCYGTMPAPGATIGEGGAFTLPGAPAEIEEGRANFLAVVCAVEGLEWLHLAHSGHRRALFSFADGGVEGQWLAP